MVQANGNSVKLHDQDTDTLSLQDSVTMQPERFRCITYLNFTVTSHEVSLPGKWRHCQVEDIA